MRDSIILAQSPFSPGRSMGWHFWRGVKRLRVEMRTEEAAGEKDRTQGSWLYHSQGKVTPEKNLYEKTKLNFKVNYC